MSMAKSLIASPTVASPPPESGSASTESSPVDCERRRCPPASGHDCDGCCHGPSASGAVGEKARVRSSAWHYGHLLQRGRFGVYPTIWANRTSLLPLHDLGKQNFAAPITRFGQSSGDSRSRGRERERGWGSKPGSGGAAFAQTEAMDLRERLHRLAMETIDLAKDPYFMRNHLGSYKCKLCLTLRNNEGNYLAHTQGKRHQTNLAKIAAREAKEAPT